MNTIVRDNIDLLFKLLVESVNEDIERIFFYKFQGFIEGLYYANILSNEEYEFLIDASLEVYF